MATDDLDPTGIFIARHQPQTAPATFSAPASVELVGHVKFVERNAPTNADGLRTVLKLRDLPGVTVRRHRHAIAIAGAARIGAHERQPHRLHGDADRPSACRIGSHAGSGCLRDRRHHPVFIFIATNRL